MDKVLVFDVWGEYAHFRKYYTTTSPLTFSIPPRTAIGGLIGAIIGLSKDEYLKYFSKEQAQIAVRILNPIKKVRLAENLINTKDDYFIPIKKGSHSPRTQIRFEFLKDAKYRIYFYHTDPNLFNKAKSMLLHHKCVYTPCLGITEHIANFEFIGEKTIREQSSTEFIKLDSALPTDSIKEIKLEDGDYFSETIPTEMELDRSLKQYRKVMFERNGVQGKGITAKVDRYWELDNNESIIFL
jgi:CRISPR-associated protein Cas5h